MNPHLHLRQRLHDLFSAAPPGVPVWNGFKARLSVELGLSDDTMHMMTGLLILTLVAVALRRAPWSRWPWAAVLIAETLNELYDLTHGADEGNWADSWHDFWITLLWPTIILAVYRRWGARTPGRSRHEVEQALE
ncbi:MAG: hypothetical protein ACRYFW_04045 [Janthinobacterium lividum]